MALVSSYANTSFLFRWCDLIYAKIIPSVNPFFLRAVPDWAPCDVEPVTASSNTSGPPHSAFGTPSYYPDVAQWKLSGSHREWKEQGPPRWLIYILVPQCAGPVTQPCALCPVFSSSSSSSSSSSHPIPSYSLWQWEKKNSCPHSWSPIAIITISFVSEASAPRCVT